MSECVLSDPGQAALNFGRWRGSPGGKAKLVEGKAGADSGAKGGFKGGEAITQAGEKTAKIAVACAGYVNDVGGNGR